MISYGIVKSITWGSSSPNLNEWGNYYSIEVIWKDGSLKEYRRIPGLCVSGGSEFLNGDELHAIYHIDDISHLGYQLMGPLASLHYEGITDDERMVAYHEEMFYIRKKIK
jgi:hypothetical protein